MQLDGHLVALDQNRIVMQSFAAKIIREIGGAKIQNVSQLVVPGVVNGDLAVASQNDRPIKGQPQRSVGADSGGLAGRP